MWNYSLDEKTERGGGYGQSEVELRYALRVKHNLVMLKVATYEESLWSVLVSMLFWSPLIWFLFFLPVSFLLLWIISSFIDLPQYMHGVYALPLAYASGLYLSLRKQSPLRDYRTRKQYVGTKTLQLDFKQQLLIAEEVFRFAPEKNRVQTVAFNKIHVSIEWNKGVEDSDYPGFYTDYVGIYLRLKSGGLKDMAWANRKLGEPVFRREYDSSDTDQAVKTQAELDEMNALLKTQNLHQK